MKNVIILIFFVVLTLSGITQTRVNSDFGIWYTVGVKKKITKKITLRDDLKIRFSENGSSLAYMYNDLNLSWRYSESIKFYAGLVAGKYFNRSDNNKWRYYGDAVFSKKYFRMIKLFYRMRLQSSYLDYAVSENGKIPEYAWRNKGGIEVTYFRFTPYVACEYLYGFANYREYDNGWKRTRYYLGCAYTHSKNLETSVYYLLQQKLNRRNPVNNHVLGIELTYSI